VKETRSSYDQIWNFWKYELSLSNFWKYELSLSIWKYEFLQIP